MSDYRDPAVGDVYRQTIAGPGITNYYRVKICNLTTGLILLQTRSSRASRRPFENTPCWVGGFWVSIEKLQREYHPVERAEK